MAFQHITFHVSSQPFPNLRKSIKSAPRLEALWDEVTHLSNSGPVGLFREHERLNRFAWQGSRTVDWNSAWVKLGINEGPTPESEVNGSLS